MAKKARTAFLGKAFRSIKSAVSGAAAPLADIAKRKAIAGLKAGGMSALKAVMSGSRDPKSILAQAASAAKEGAISGASRPPLYKSARRGKRAGNKAGLIKAIRKNPKMSAAAKKKAMAKLR